MFNTTGRAPGRNWATLPRCPLLSTSLRAGKARLESALPQMRAARSFDELLNLIERRLNDIRGLGELYFYDTALRLGAYLRLMPNAVYMHRGTAVGAKATGIQQRYPVDQLAPPSARPPSPARSRDRGFFMRHQARSLEQDVRTA
jgi:hypothetical protein